LYSCCSLDSSGIRHRCGARSHFFLDTFLEALEVQIAEHNWEAVGIRVFAPPLSNTAESIFTDLPVRVLALVASAANQKHRDTLLLFEPKEGR